MARPGPIQITADKLRQLKAELEQLITVGRKSLADKLDQYRTDDNSEDQAAYSEVLEEKRWMDERISELQDILENAQVTKPKCDIGKVSLGCLVTVERSGKRLTFIVVPSLDADPRKGKISDESPMGKALLGKKVGEKVVVNSPDSPCNCKILEIKAAVE
jgi:transcription elongation factor GreA